jgi:hypothetical protein
MLWQEVRGRSGGRRIERTGRGAGVATGGLPTGQHTTTFELSHFLLCIGTSKASEH